MSSAFLEESRESKLHRVSVVLELRQEKDGIKMTEKMISATKLKAIIKALPNNLLYECGQLGNLVIRKDVDGSIVIIGIIDFTTGALHIGRCPICAVDLEATDMKGKRRCPICNNVFQG